MKFKNTRNTISKRSSMPKQNFRNIGNKRLLKDEYFKGLGS